MEENNQSMGNNNSVLNDSRATNSNNTANSHNVDNHSVDNHSVTTHSVDNHSMDSHDTHVINLHGLSVDEALKLAQTIEFEKQMAREEAKREMEEKQVSQLHAQPYATQQKSVALGTITPIPGSEKYRDTTILLPPEASQATVHPLPPEKKRNMLLPACVIVVLLIGGCVLFLSRSEKKEQPDSQPAPTEISTSAKVQSSQNSAVQPKASSAPKTSNPATKETTPTKTSQQPLPTKTIDTNYEVGMRAFNTGDGYEAVKAFKASGSKESLNMLGKIYENGCGSIEANPMMARKYYKEAEKKIDYMNIVH